MEVTAEVRTDVALLTPPRREGDESAALGSQASVGFLSYGGPLAVSCSTFETPTKTSPVTRRRWSPARSLSQVSQASRASCRSRSRSPRSSSFPLGQPDPPTPEAIEATQNSQVIVVDDDPSQPGPGPMNLVDMGLSQALWLPEDIKTQDKIWLWSQSVPPTADSISCTQLPRRYHIVSQTPPKVQRSEAVVGAPEASVLAQHQAFPEESFGAAQGRDAESHMDLNLATSPLVLRQQRVPETLEDCEPDENLEEEMPFSLDLGLSQPSQDLAIQSQVSVHKAEAMPLQSQVDERSESAKDAEATKACSQANAGIQNAGSQPAPETSQHPTSTPHGSSPEQAAASPMPPVCQSAAIFELAKDAEVAARPEAAGTVDVSECFGQPATASPNLVQAEAMPLQSQVDERSESAKDAEATKACSQANAGIQNAGSQPALETSQHPTSTPHGSSPEQAAADKSEDAEWWKANTCETDGEHGELWRLLEQMHASAHSGVGDAANASAVGQSGAAEIDAEFPMETSTKDPSQPTHQDLSLLKLQEDMQHAAEASSVGQAGAAETDAEFPMETSTKDPSQPTHQDLNLKLQEDMQHAADASALKQAGAVKTCAVGFVGQEHAGPLIHEKEPLEADWHMAEDPDVSENETSQKSSLPAAQPSPVTEDSRLGEASQGASDLQQEDPLEFWRSLFGDVLRPRRAAAVA